MWYVCLLAEPDSPKNVVLTPRTVEMENVLMDVTWEPPDMANGIIENYNVYYRKLPWNVERVLRKDHCGLGALPLFSVQYKQCGCSLSTIYSRRSYIEPPDIYRTAGYI